MLQIDSSEQVVEGVYIKRLPNFVSTKTQLQIPNNVCQLRLSLASKAKDQAEKLQLISLGPTAILLKTAEMGAHQTVRNVSLLTLGPKQWLAHQCWHPPPPIWCVVSCCSCRPHCLKHSGQWVIQILELKHISSLCVCMYMWHPEIELHATGTHWKGHWSYVHWNGQVHVQNNKSVCHAASSGRASWKRCRNAALHHCHTLSWIVAGCHVVSLCLLVPMRNNQIAEIISYENICWNHPSFTFFFTLCTLHKVSHLLGSIMPYAWRIWYMQLKHNFSNILARI